MKLSSISSLLNQTAKTQLDDYKIIKGKDLGQGAFGKVRTAYHKKTKKEVAIKYVNKNVLLRTDDSIRILGEMDLLKNLDHPNVIKAFEIFEDNQYFYIVMEKITEGDLFNFICENNRLSFKLSTFFIYQIINSIVYLHSKNVCHRDLKPENLLITKDHIIKICDFGLSKKYKDKNSRLFTICGSDIYSSPEMLKKNSYLPEPVDVWGIGILLYMMCFGNIPFDDPDGNISNIANKIVNCIYDIPYYCDANIKDLLKRIFVADPEKRITLNEIRQHNVYYIGRANFLKLFKIYDENGFISPQVKCFIDNETLKYMKTHDIIPNNKNAIQNSTEFKLISHELLHKIEWNDYYINTENSGHYNLDDSDSGIKINIINEEKNIFTSNKSKNNSKIEELSKIESESGNESNEEDNENNDKNNNQLKNSNNLNSSSLNKNDVFKSIENSSKNKQINFYESLLKIQNHDNLLGCKAMNKNIPNQIFKNDKYTKLITQAIFRFGGWTYSFDNNNNLTPKFKIYSKKILKRASNK